MSLEFSEVQIWNRNATLHKSNIKELRKLMAYTLAYLRRFNEACPRT